MRNAVCLSLLALLLAPALTRAQTRVNPRLLVLVDTSGSMVWHFANNTTCGGDGDPASLYTDATQSGKNYYPGTSLGGGLFDGMNSRIYAAKKSLYDGAMATGDWEPGLMRFVASGSCPNAANCCALATGACFCDTDFINNPGGASCAPATAGKLTWFGGCGTISAGQSVSGGQVLVNPAAAAYTGVLQWTDNVEDFRDSGAGAPNNGELRPNGNAPIAGAVRSAGVWYNNIRNGNLDPKINCRPYALVLITDGSDTCEVSPSSPTTAPPAAVTALYAINAVNPVKTYVIGVGIQAGDTTNTTMLNSMAANGGTGQAFFATDRATAERELGAVIALSLKPELCNGLDDNCDGVPDEPFPDKGLSCAVGLGACRRTGVRVCAGDGLSTVCNATPGLPTTEVCDGIDNNCNGLVDEGGVCP